jgi:hypothetical protein
MRRTTILTLAALAVVAAAVIIGHDATSSKGEIAENDIVLCKHAALAECGEAEIWGAGKNITLETNHLKIVGTQTLLCTKVELIGKTNNATGLSLGWTVEVAKILECGKGCTITVEEPSVAEFTVDTPDNYLSLIELKLKTLCGGFACVYKGHNSLDMQETNTTGKPTVIAKEEPLTVTGTGCGTTAKWTSQFELKSTTLPILFSLLDLSGE